MRLHRPPPRFVAVLVWSVALACVLVGAWDRELFAAPSDDGPAPASRP